MRRAAIGGFFVLLLFCPLSADASYWTKTSGLDGNFPLFPDGNLFKVQTLDADTFVAVGTQQEGITDFNYRLAFKSTDGGETITPIYDGAGYADNFFCKGLIKINDIHFFDANRGMIFGGWGGPDCGGMFSASHNYAAYTENGGGTWSEREFAPDEPGAIITGAVFLDNLHAVATGASNNLWKTADGGTSWFFMRPADHEFDGIFYNSVTTPTVDNIYAAGEWYPDQWTDDDWGGPLDEDWGQKMYPDMNATRGTLIHSSDGGNSWSYLLSTDEMLPPFQYSVGFHKVQFIGSNGWLLAVNAEYRLVDLMYSTDGGLSWESADLPFTPIGRPGNGYVLADFQMLTPADGWAVGAGTRGDSVILKTSDGGKTWDADDYAGFGPLMSIHLINGRIGYATGKRATVLRYNAPDRAPVADAGDDRTAFITLLTSLDGSRSHDPDGEPITYLWTQTNGPDVSLLGPATVAPSFVPTEKGNYVFSLVVSDGELSSAPDSVKIHVIIPGSGDDDYGDDAGDDASGGFLDDAGDDTSSAPESFTVHPKGETATGSCGC